MPTTDSVKKSAQRRAARKAAREAAVETSQAETENLSATVKASKAKAAARPAARKATETNKEKVMAARRAVEEQVKVQDQTLIVRENAVDPQSYIRPGAQLSLHQLNRISLKQKAAARDEAREIALAAGEGAYRAAAGARQRRAAGDRWSKRNDADAAIAAARAKSETR